MQTQNKNSLKGRGLQTEIQNAAFFFYIETFQLIRENAENLTAHLLTAHTHFPSFIIFSSLSVGVITM